MIKVRFRKRIHSAFAGGLERDFFLHRDTCVHMLPLVGMYTPEDDEITCIDMASWDGESFDIWVKVCKKFLDSSEEFEELIQSHLDKGWVKDVS